MRETVPYPLFPGAHHTLEVYPPKNGLINFRGFRIHSNLQFCLDNLNKLFGWNINTFDKIITILRNPYDLAASVYFWQRNAALYKPYMTNQIYKLANTSFAEFLRIETPIDVCGYYRINRSDSYIGDIPKNMHFLFFEDIISQSYKLVEDWGFEHDVFPHTKQNPHPHFSTMYDDESEELVYRYFEDVFSMGFYKRYDGLSL